MKQVRDDIETPISNRSGVDSCPLGFSIPMLTISVLMLVNIDKVILNDKDWFDIWFICFALIYIHFENYKEYIHWKRHESNNRIKK